MIARSWIAATLTCVAFVSAPRAEEPRLETLFPNRAEIQLDDPAESGLLRLELPIEVVAACRSDLSDLRILGSDGRVIGFATDLGPPAGFRETIVARHALSIVDASRSRVDLPGAEDLLTEAYVLQLPEGLSSGRDARAWDLVLEVSAGPHLRQVTVEALAAGADVRATGRALRHGSIFRLAGNAASNARLSLPALPGPRLRVRLTGQGTRFLEPRFRLETSWPLRSREPDWITLRLDSTQQQDGNTVLEAPRPSGLIPEWIEIESRDRTFHRRVTITDLRPGQPDRNLGGGAIYELPGAADHPALVEHKLRIGRARGERLRITIENGDSAPLREIVVRAGQRRPYLLFPHDGTPRTSATIATLFFGGGRVDPPRFDVAALLDRLPADVVGDRFPAAHLAPTEENPAFSITPILAYAQRPGAELDEAGFRFLRNLSAQPSPDGLNRLDLSAEDLAVLQDDLRDLRIVDAGSRQWAFLIDRSTRTEQVNGTAERIESKDGRSRYSLQFPFDGLPLDGLTLVADAPFFDRQYQIVRREERFGEPDQVRTLSKGRLARRAGQESVHLSLPAMRGSDLELIVTDGDDAPLIFTEVSVAVPVAELFFPAPAGEYRLLLGGEDVTQPRYELERIRDLVLAVAAAPTQAGALVDNSAFRAHLGSGGKRLLFWLAIVLTVGVLTILTLRLARKPQDG